MPIIATMHFRGRRLARCLLVTLAGMPVVASSAADVRGDTVAYEAPGGIREACVAIEHAPDGRYSDADRSDEQALCAIDFYSGSFALCPKVFSTSPGTLVYDLRGGPFAGQASAFETKHCGQRRIIKSGVSGGPVSFKMTMNTPDTSATFAPASWLYYHFSRYFDTDVHVPVSVYRSMDKQQHFERVVRTGVAASSGSGSSKMNHAGWKALDEGARDPSSYRPMRELYTDGGRQIFGVLLRTEGRRYGAEINGTRKSGWGAGQNRDFQETAPFLALRHDGALQEAIATGLQEANRDPELRKAMRDGTTPLQMVFWMRELAEIVLLDYIFSQQDRVGNIDYVDYWYWVDGGDVRRAPAKGNAPPSLANNKDPVRIRRSIINDNDAAGRLPYANFAKTTGMLDKLRHFPASTYRRLQQLANDFDTAGPHYEWLSTAFGLSDRQVAQVVANTLQASRVLAQNCHAGQLRFSLEPDEFMVNGTVNEQDEQCAYE